MEAKIDWVILLNRNGARCAGCGKIINDFAPNMCNVRTLGLKEKYGHLEFQIVLDIGDDMLGYILNVFGLRVQAGERFYDGQILNDILKDYDVKLMAMEDDGEKVLRVIIPDANHKYPQDAGCAAYYNLQALPTDVLIVEKHPSILN